MPTTTIESLVSHFEKEYGVHLSKIPRKKIIYDGKTKHGKSIVVIMPTSKIYKQGNGWVDFTQIQVEDLKKYHIAISIFRLSNGATYYIDMSKLFPLLTKKSIMENKREGKHWKMHIWSDRIDIKTGGEMLFDKEHGIKVIGDLVH
mgnify:CR=1 FL=1